MFAPLFALGESHDGRPGYVQLYAGNPPEAVQVTEYGVPAMAPLGTVQLMFSLGTMLIAIVWVANCFGCVALSLTVGVKMKPLGGDEGTVPVMVMVAPVVPLGESHDGMPGKPQVYPGVPPDAVQVAEYVVPVTTSPLGATQLMFSLVTTAIAMVCAAVCAVGVVVSVAVAVKVYELGGGEGIVPVKTMEAPLFPLGESHDGRFARVQL